MISTKLKSNNHKIAQSSNRQALSIILILLIISSILTGTVIVGETIVRHTQIVKGAEVSEKAFFAAETAVEKAIYGVLKNYASVTTVTEGSIIYGATSATYSASVSIDAENPDTGIDITNSDPWIISLETGESFQLNLDLNSTAYPTALRIDRSGDGLGDLIIYQCTASSNGCSSTENQIFYSNFTGQDINLSPSIPINYYRIRINNSGGTGTYTLKPTSAALPIGVNITAEGSYGGYERQINDNYPKWQKFGI